MQVRYPTIWIERFGCGINCIVDFKAASNLIKFIGQAKSCTFQEGEFIVINNGITKMYVPRLDAGKSKPISSLFKEDLTMVTVLSHDLFAKLSSKVNKYPLANIELRIYENGLSFHVNNSHSYINSNLGETKTPVLKSITILSEMIQDITKQLSGDIKIS
jgi:hypothetical protein